MTSEEDLQDAASFAAEWDADDSRRRIVESLIADSRALRKLTEQNAKLIRALRPFAIAHEDAVHEAEPPWVTLAAFEGAARVLKEIEDGR